jgi:hypothetical protein
MEHRRMSDVVIVGPGGVKATLHDDGSITYPAGAGPTGRRAEAGMAPLPPSMRKGDDDLGIGDKELPTGKTVQYGPGGYPASDGGPATRVFDHGPRTQDQINNGRDSHISQEMDDPGARMIAEQAALSPLLHLAGMGVSAAGRALENTAGGQAARVLAEKGGGAMVRDLSPEAEAELAHIRQMREAAPERAPMLDRREEAILEQGINPDPSVSAARETLRFKGPHGGDLGTGAAGYLLGHMGGHGSVGLASAAVPLLMRNAAPIAGRLAAPMANAGTRMAPELVPPSSLLLDMAMSGGKQ